MTFSTRCAPHGWPTRTVTRCRSSPGTWSVPNPLRNDQFLVCYTGHAPPEHVKSIAATRGVVFAPIAAPSILSDRLAELRPGGYLVNDPGWHPTYLSRELIEAAADLQLVTYMGSTFEASDYAAFFDLDALRELQVVFTT